MSLIPTKQIDGDIAVGRNVTVGGKATVRGSATIGHNLKVEGWLDAKNIKGPNKGLFSNAEKLRIAFPHPHDGWVALVGVTLPADVWIADGGEWVASGEQGGEFVIDMTEYEERLSSLQTMIDKIPNDTRTILRGWPVRVEPDDLDAMINGGKYEQDRIYYSTE